MSCISSVSGKQCSNQPTRRKQLCSDCLHKEKQSHGRYTTACDDFSRALGWIFHHGSTPDQALQMGIYIYKTLFNQSNTSRKTYPTDKSTLSPDQEIWVSSMRIDSLIMDILDKHDDKYFEELITYKKLCSDLRKQHNQTFYKYGTSPANLKHEEYVNVNAWVTFIFLHRKIEIEKIAQACVAESSEDCGKCTIGPKNESMQCLSFCRSTGKRCLRLKLKSDDKFFMNFGYYCTFHLSITNELMQTFNGGKLDSATLQKQEKIIELKDLIQRMDQAKITFYDYDVRFVKLYNEVIDKLGILGRKKKKKKKRENNKEKDSEVIEQISSGEFKRIGRLFFHWIKTYRYAFIADKTQTKLANLFMTLFVLSISDGSIVFAPSDTFDSICEWGALQVFQTIEMANDVCLLSSNLEEEYEHTLSKPVRFIPELIELFSSSIQNWNNIDKMFAVTFVQQNKKLFMNNIIRLVIKCFPKLEKEESAYHYR
jgi:hypothetical protein